MPGVSFSPESRPSTQTRADKSLPASLLPPKPAPGCPEAAISPYLELCQLPTQSFSFPGGHKVSMSGYSLVLGQVPSTPHTHTHTLYEFSRQKGGIKITENTDCGQSERSVLYNRKSHWGLAHLVSHLRVCSSWLTTRREESTGNSLWPPGSCVGHFREARVCRRGQQSQWRVTRAGILWDLAVSI